jgi:hypothetical protein
MRLLLLTFMFSSLCHAQQQKKQDFFLSEYNVSVNHSIYNFGVNTFGYGAGGYTSFLLRPNKQFLTGIEFNYSKQLQAYEFNGGHSETQVDTSDFLISMNSLVIPANLRFTFGNKTQFFTDFGFFVEAIISVNGLGFVSPTNTTSLHTFSSGENIPTFNTGVNCGFGLSRQFGANTYFLKTELKYGILNNRYLKLCLGMRLN